VTGDAQPPRLSVAGATVTFDGSPVVDGVDLDLTEGEVLVVLGPSGSGKSTLLRAVAGLQPLDAGHIALDGQSLAGVPPHRRGVGLMFQDHALFPHRDVAGNVAFGLRMAGWRDARVAARVRELLELVDLPGRERRNVRTLSGGEQQRVALARALAPSPRLLLLDEPLGALDRALRERLVGDLRRLFTRLHLSVVAVTHDQHEAFALADRVAVMDAGRVLQQGHPAEVWGRPAGRRVAEVLGLPNLLDATVVTGRTDLGWGPVPIEAPDGPAAVHVRPAGLHLDAAGPVAATVVATTFQGDRVEVQLDTPTAALVLHAPVDGAPGVGDAVRLRVDPGAVVPLDR